MQGGLPAKPYGLLKKNFTLLLLSGRLMTQSQSSLELYFSGQPVNSTEPVTAVRSPHDGFKVGGCGVVALPLQLLPLLSSWYPLLQVHSKEPGVLVQM